MKITRFAREVLAKASGKAEQMDICHCFFDNIFRTFSRIRLFSIKFLTKIQKKEGVSKVKQSVLFKLLTHSLYKNIVSQGCMPPIIEQQLSSSYHRYTSRYSIPWLEQTIADHLLNSELPPQHR